MSMARGILAAMILITGGCGFIGAHLIRRWLASQDEGRANPDEEASYHPLP
jgi:nucleoside-diphosphate-sugar epimerase